MCIRDSKETDDLALEEDVAEKKKDALSFAVSYGFEIGEDAGSAKRILEDVRKGVRSRDDLKNKEGEFNKAVDEFSELKNLFIEANEGVDYFSGKAGDLSKQDEEDALEKIEDELKDLELEDIDGDLDDLTRLHQTVNDSIKDLKGETEYSEIQDEIESLKEEILELEIEAASLEIARHLLGEATEKYAEGARPRFLQEVSDYYAEITDEDREVDLDPDSGASVYVNVEGRRVELEQLSTGSRAQLYLSFRLAMADQDAKNKRGGLKIPLICDDSLVHFDDERAEATLPILKKIAEENRQVILFTCHKRTRDSAEAKGVKVIELG